MKQRKDQASYQECGKVLLQMECNVYKICCSICEDYTTIESFISHYQKHLNVNIKSVDFCKRNNPRILRNQKVSENIEPSLRAERSITNNNRTRIQSLKKNYKDDDSFDNEEEDYDDFLWDNITDSDEDNDNTYGSSDDEPLIDIQALLKKSDNFLETEFERFSDSENKIDPETNTNTKRNNEKGFEKTSKEATQVVESSDDTDGDDDSYTWDIDNESIEDETQINTDIIESSDGDDDDSYAWDIDSCESDYPDINAKRRKKNNELLDKCNIQLDECGAIMCKFCPNRFNTKVGLMSHLRTHQIPFEKKEKPEFKCEQCGQIFRSERALGTHMYKHTGIFCEICNKQFSAVGNMIRHKLKHSGIKSHKCTQCDKRFYTINELDTHNAKHTGVRKLMCELCGKPCRDRGVLTQHMLRHTGERPVKCNQCNKSFYSNHDLKEHVVIHSEERPFSCEICGASFQRKKSLRVHKKIHSNEPCTEECTLCGKKFAKPSGLLSHMRVHDTVYGLSYPVGGWRGDKQSG